MRGWMHGWMNGADADADLPRANNLGVTHPPHLGGMCQGPPNQMISMVETWSHVAPWQPKLGLVSSMLPPFAIELVERACDYVTRIPKPRNVKSGKVSLELATMGLLHGALTIAGSQTDKDLTQNWAFRTTWGGFFAIA